MAGIYIHIPFCKQACSYCNFHFSTNLSRKHEVLSSIHKELILRSSYLEGEVIETIYLGGGTPSQLSETEINQLFDVVSKHYELDNPLEITLEANPDDLSLAYLKDLKQTPINRLSIGIQSFFEEDLRFMNRAHSATEAIRSIKDAQNTGFENLNIDLIFGSQTTTNEMWEKNLAYFFDLSIPHLSAYSLTVEEKTALADCIKKGKVASVDDEKNYTQYLMLQKAISAKNYQQYELSNYCKNDRYSKHNTSYWFGKKYLGIGPSAHSYNEISRQWNVSNNMLYSKALEKGSIYFELENLSEADRYNELLITSLRTKWGLDFIKLEGNFSKDIYDHFLQCIDKLSSQKVEKSRDSLKVKNQFLFQSDEIIRDLMK